MFCIVTFIAALGVVVSRWYLQLTPFPKKSHSVKRLREGLSNNEIPWTKDMLKSELFELCSQFAEKPEFLIDRIARKEGHSILRTPPSP